MISIQFVFISMVIFFGMVGAIRGWQKEVIATAGLIGAVAFLYQFGDYLLTLGNVFFRFADTATSNLPADTITLQRQFWIQAIFLSLIAFFSYQIISSLADRAPGTSRGDRVRYGFQSRFIGAVVGMFNGYLLVGSLWGFLEYRIIATGYERINSNTYPFQASGFVTKVQAEAIDTAINVVEYLPLNVFGPGIWLLLFFISFFIVIIALI